MKSSGKRLCLLVILLSSSQGVFASELLSVDIKRLSVESGVKVALAAMAACREQGIQIGVVVMDRGGNVQVALRDTLAADMTLTLARQKAYAAVSFNASTSALDRQSRTPLAGLDGLMLVGGGLPIQAGGLLYGSIAVSGAPTEEQDERCAERGIEAILEELEIEG